MEPPNEPANALLLLLLLRLDTLRLTDDAPPPEAAVLAAELALEPEASLEGLRGAEAFPPSWSASRAGE